MHTLSMSLRSSSRATMAAGTRPPRVMHTMASNGPADAKRHARARQSRWNWSQETGKAFGEVGDIGLLFWLRGEWTLHKGARSPLRRPSRLRTAAAAPSTAARSLPRTTIWLRKPLVEKDG